MRLIIRNLAGKAYPGSRNNLKSPPAATRAQAVTLRSPPPTPPDGARWLRTPRPRSPPRTLPTGPRRSPRQALRSRSCQAMRLRSSLLRSPHPVASRRGKRPASCAALSTAPRKEALPMAGDHSAGGGLKMVWTRGLGRSAGGSARLCSAAAREERRSVGRLRQ